MLSFLVPSNSMLSFPVPHKSILSFHRLEPQRAVQQLRACGVLETVRLSAAGYPSRWTYNEFFQRYRLLLRSGQVRRDDVRQMCEYILHKWIQVIISLHCIYIIVRTLQCCIQKNCERR